MTLTQGHRDGCQKIFPHPWVNHVWLEEISFRGFPGKLKSVGRTAVAETAVAAVAAEMAAAEMDQRKSPGYPR